MIQGEVVFEFNLFYISNSQHIIWHDVALIEEMLAK